MNNEQIEQEIQEKGLTAPRVTLADIEANIEREYFFTAYDGVDGAEIKKIRSEEPDKPVTLCPFEEESEFPEHVQSLSLLTFCVLVLKNGFTVTGESACVSPENFDADIGCLVAYENAVEKLWPLMGYALKEKLHVEG